jgi:hypothetical protein
LCAQQRNRVGVDVIMFFETGVLKNGDCSFVSFEREFCYKKCVLGVFGSV